MTTDQQNRFYFASLTIVGPKLVQVGLDKSLKLSYDGQTPHVDTLLLTICEIIRFMKASQVPYWDDVAIASMIDAGLIEFLLKSLLVVDRTARTHSSSELIWDEALDILEGIEDLIRDFPDLATKTVDALKAKSSQICNEVDSVESILTSRRDELLRVKAVVGLAVPAVASSPASDVSTSILPACSNKRDASCLQDVPTADGELKQGELKIFRFCFVTAVTEKKATSQLPSFQWIPSHLLHNHLLLLALHSGESKRIKKTATTVAS